MASDILSTARKAHIINEDLSFYGTFAEIGAGQEVARHFFQAGHASNTIAKTMSAYDMTFSTEIYGEAPRFVSRERLDKMLDHEFSLLTKRLPADGRCFFAFANTVATSSHSEEAGSHAWMGVRFQVKPEGPCNEVLLHVRMLDRLRLSQQETIGVLGTNLIYGIRYLIDDERMFINSLVDNLTNDRIEVDYISCSGPDLTNFCNKKLSLELLTQQLTSAVIFSPKGEPLQATDYLYGRPVVVLRGTFRPITNVVLKILDLATQDCKNHIECAAKDVRALLEFTVVEANSKQSSDFSDYLDRIEAINATGHPVLVSRYPLFFQLKSYLRRCSNNYIGLVIGSAMLPRLFDEKYYTAMKGGLLNAFGKLFDENTQMLVFPFKENEQCTSTKTFHPDSKFNYLYQYLLENKRIVDILGCDDVNTSTSSEKVRELLQAKNPTWKEHVPPEVVELIEKKKLFGFN